MLSDGEHQWSRLPFVSSSQLLAVVDSVGSRVVVEDVLSFAGWELNASAEYVTRVYALPGCLRLPVWCAAEMLHQRSMPSENLFLDICWRLLVPCVVECCLLDPMHWVMGSISGACFPFVSFSHLLAVVDSVGSRVVVGDVLSFASLEMECLTQSMLPACLLFGTACVCRCSVQQSGFIGEVCHMSICSWHLLAVVGTVYSRVLSSGPYALSDGEHQWSMSPVLLIYAPADDC